MNHVEPKTVASSEKCGRKQLQNDGDLFNKRHPNFALALVAGSYPGMLIAVIAIAAIAVVSLHFFGL